MKAIATIPGYLYKIKKSKTGKTNELTILSNDQGFRAYVPIEIKLEEKCQIKVTGELKSTYNKETKKGFTFIMVNSKDSEHSVQVIKVQAKTEITEEGKNLLDPKKK